MQLNSNYEIAVIGGGPAGSASAALLSAKGLKVCLIEKKQFPREVLCGEFLSAEVIEFIMEQNLYAQFLDLKPESISSFRFMNDNGRELYSLLNFEAYALKRSSFDLMLMKYAEEKGTEIIIPAEVKSITKNTGEYLIRIKTIDEEYDITAAAVIAAYGKQNILDKHLNRRLAESKTGITGIKFHLNEKYFNKPPAGEITIYAADNIYCGINKVNDADYTVCFLDNLKEPGVNPKDSIHRLLAKNKKFKQLFTTGTESVFNDLKIYGTGNLYFGKRELYKNGIYFAGDAAGVIAPLSGDGIGMALESAKLIADHLGEYKNADPDQYVYKWNKLFRTRLKTAKIIQTVILNSSLRNSALSIMSIFPALVPYFIYKTRSNMLQR